MNSTDIRAISVFSLFSAMRQKNPLVKRRMEFSIISHSNAIDEFLGSITLFLWKIYVRRLFK